MRRVRGYLERVTAGAPVAPLAVLFGLNFVDEFDRIAFAALAPEIRDAFGIGDAAIVTIAVVSTIFVLFAALPLGVVADRVHRVRLAGASALLWGLMAVLTGAVAAVVLLFFVRLLSGIGKLANDVVHPTLLTDYYEPRALPRVFEVHRMASPLGAALSGVVAGGLASAVGWRWTFVLLALPTFLLLLGLTKLREPVRGETVDRELALEAQAQGHVPFGEARRQLFGVRSLRRLWAASLLLGVGGALIIPIFLALFFEDVYGFGPFGRGAVQTLYAGGVVAGLLVGGALASRAVQADDEPRLATIAGLAGMWIGGGFLLMIASPWAAASVAFVPVLALGAGAFQPAYYPLVGRIAPARVRAQAFAWSLIFIAAGSILAILLADVGEAQGYRPVLAVVGVTLVVAGLIARTAHAYVRRDVEQADQALAVAAALLHERTERGGTALLTCRGVEVAYGQVQVLFGVDLDVRPGEIVALLGTNGAGKSTLLRAVSGLTDPMGGTIVFDGRDITHADGNQTAALGLAQVPGGRAIFPTLSVAEHLRLAAWPYRREVAYGVGQATSEVLDLFPVLAERRDQLAGDLSGGEQQMLGLAMAFLQRPRLLVVDELSLGLAPTVVRELLAAIRRIRDQGTAVLIVEQSVNVALTVADRAYFMEKGEVRFEGEAADLLARDDLLRSVFLEGAAGVARGTGAREVSAARRRARGNGQAASTSPARPDAPATVLHVRDLTRRFGGIRAVDGVGFVLHEREILGVIGPNGAGKTTLFDLVSGFLTPDGGQIVLGATDVTRLPAHRRAALGLGRSFQDARLVPSLTVAENLALGLERHLEWRDHVASALRLPAVARLEEDVAWTVHDLVELLGLGAYRDKFVRELSTGTRRIVDLGMVLAHDPDVLLLDEPSSGIAQRETEALGPLLLRVRDEARCALVVIEHDMPLISAISDRLLALDLGRPIAEGAPHEVIRHPRVVESYLGGPIETLQRSGEVVP